MDSSIVLLKLDSKNILSYKIKLLQTLNFHTDLNRATRERGLLEEIIKLTQKNKTILYLLKKDNKFVGLIALSASSIDEMPVIQVDYLFVDFKYRKRKLEQLNATISKYLLSFAIDTAEKIKQTIGLRYLALYPDAQSDTLICHYKEMGFNQLNKYWLVIKLK